MIDNYMRIFIEHFIEQNINSNWWHHRANAAKSMIFEKVLNDEGKIILNNSLEPILSLIAFENYYSDFYNAFRSPQISKWFFDETKPKEVANKRNRIVYLDQQLHICDFDNQYDFVNYLTKPMSPTKSIPMMVAEDNLAECSETVSINIIDYMITPFNHFYSLGIPKNLADLSIRIKRIKQI